MEDMNLGRELKYIYEGRGGQILYRDSISEISFSTEIGGGDCLVIIFTPPAEQWSQETKRKIEERDDIIKFVAEQTTKDHTSKGHYKIFDDYVEVFSR